ncbi:MAG TPA: hypothetical protein VHG08_10855 [Longimicrobium sp.]|nr:hypothetical protein [Longimicrobium sp.]
MSPSADPGADRADPVLARVAAEHGTPCFVYDMDAVQERLARLERAFGGRFRVSYAMKSNPNPALLARLRARVPFLDVSSGGELELALEQGWEPGRISFTGPAKGPAELELAVAAGIGEVVVESLEEARELSRVAVERGRVQPVLARLAPARLPGGFGVNMAGKPCQFGIDEEDAEAVLQEVLALPGLSLEGFHVYSGTQSLRAQALAENYGIFVELFRRFAGRFGLTPRKLVFGSGLGIPYHEGDVALDLEALAAQVNPLLDELRAEPRFAGADLVLETGRYVVGEAGVYLTGVLRVKESRGTAIAVCNGGMNHHLGACGHLGTVIHRNYRMFKVGAEDAPPAERPYDLVGPLCTTIDTLGHRVKLPELRAGDVIAVRCSGAYGATASPIHFIRHAPPREVLVESTPVGRRVEDVSWLGAPGAAAAAEAG